MAVYNLNVDQVFEEAKSSISGLSNEQVAKNLQRYGRNVIKVKKPSLFKKLLEPFKGVFMLILIAAVGISLLQNEFLDAFIIAAIILISAIVFYIQSFSTDRVLKALNKTDRQIVKVIRAGQIAEIDKELLVPGDVIFLAEGDKVPADARIIHAENLRCDESILTGESKPVNKQPHHLKGEKAIYEQSNMLFQGTFIVAGNTKALVVASGNNTEYGQIAKLSSNDKPISPVQIKIDQLISRIVIVVFAVAIVTFGLSMFRGIELVESLRFVMSLTVSAVPEGLPVAVSIILALGMRRMAKKKALIRSMSAIENIGTVTLIATDKTGTLTKNKLSVQDIWQLHDRDLKDVCSIIRRSINSKDGVFHDPLDIAMFEFANKYDSNDKLGVPAKILPFEVAYAMSGNIWQNVKTYDLYIKGAPEKILSYCQLNIAESRLIQAAIDELTGRGLRVIALAYQKERQQTLNNFGEFNKNDLTFESLIAVADELRPQSKKAVSQAMSAGVKVCMITGDHFETAFAIGRQLGLVEHRNQVFDTSKMEGMSQKELETIVAQTVVYTRVLPENKHRLLDLFKKHHITAMTGDGVNDVPALTNAHIGIAMGSGSQIAKDAGEIILLDNNFASIISALREGRQIYDNIRRMLFYLLSTNLGEVMIALGALLIGMPLPLIAVQILWVNLVTDTCLVIPLGLEPPDGNVLNRPPRRAGKAIIGKRSLTRLLILAVSMTIIGLLTFSYFLQYHPEDYARTVAFTVIVVMQWANAFNARSEWQLLFKRQLTFNSAFIVGLSIAVVLQMLALFGPLQSALHIVPVNVLELFIASLVSFVAIIVIDEVFKLFYHQKPKH